MRSKVGSISNNNIKRALSSNAIYLVLIVLVIVFAILCRFKGINYLSSGNISNIFVQTSVVGVSAIGTSIVILTGGIDLSTGSMMAFNGIFLATLVVKGGVPLALAVIITLIVGFGVGLFIGLGISKGKIPPFIMTLAMMNVAEGCALAICGGQPVSGLPRSLNSFATATPLGIPSFIYCLIGLFALFVFIMHKTAFGYHVYALGGNRSAARLSGINTNMLEIQVYGIAGLLNSVSAVLLLARLSYASPTSGVGYEMDIIGSCVVGGISMSGGKGKVFNTLIGALILTVIKNGLQMLDISSYFQQIVTGAIIAIAVFLDKADERKAE